MAPKLSIIIPTIGRSTLAATLESIDRQAFRPFEVLVVGDGPQPLARARCKRHRRGYPIRYFETPPTHDWGGTQRNLAIERAWGEWISFQDDDDTYTSDAFQLIADTLPYESRLPMVYRMRYPGGFTIWDYPVLKMGNVGSQMLVVPAEPGRIGRFGLRYQGDWDFIRDTVRLRGGKAIFRTEVITEVQPHRDRFQAHDDMWEGK